MLAIRHMYAQVHSDGLPGIGPTSTDAEILSFTATQALGFAAVQPPMWIVFLPESGNRARLWRVLQNGGESRPADIHRHFDLKPIDLLDDLQKRLVIRWPGPIKWYMSGAAASKYPVLEIADSRLDPFPGFDKLWLDRAALQAVINEPRYATWRAALSAVAGVYLITDMSDGRQYVGKADGALNLLQRWTVYAANGHGGNVELQGLDPSTFRYSVLRVFDPSTSQGTVNAAESHYKDIIGSRIHGLNKN